MTRSKDIYATLMAQKQSIRTSATAIPAEIIEWMYVPADLADTFRCDIMTAPRQDRYKVTRPVSENSVLTVFNTIAAGDVLWQGKIRKEMEGFSEWRGHVKPCREAFGNAEMSYKNRPASMDWMSMFLARLPAVLTKPDGQTVHGRLRRHYHETSKKLLLTVETFDLDKKDADALTPITADDHLAVYKKVTDGHIAWQGKMMFKNDEAGSCVEGKPCMTRRHPQTPQSDRFVTAAFRGAPVKITNP